jgi:glyoxylase-like metal-dependent hydrolase (beta-lactamase superfamily II)
MRNWQVGSVRITQIVESKGASPPSFFYPDVGVEDVQRHRWLLPHFAHRDGRLFASIHCFVIESAGRRIVVDTCVGNDKERSLPMWNRLQGPFLEQMAEAGFPAGSIDTVLCTHLHIDHVGWNTRLVEGRWVPTFPNARYLFGRIEYAHWKASGDREGRQVIADSVQPIVDAGLADAVETDHVLTPEVRLEPTPGHTPGHVSVRIVSAGAEAVITGDLMHHPIQCCEPDWPTHFDVDREQARVTRRAFLQRHADRPVLVLGTHFAAPTGGRIVSAGTAWEFAVEADLSDGRAARAAGAVKPAG